MFPHYNNQRKLRPDYCNIKIEYLYNFFGKFTDGENENVSISLGEEIIGKYICRKIP